MSDRNHDTPLNAKLNELSGIQLCNRSMFNKSFVMSVLPVAFIPSITKIQSVGTCREIEFCKLFCNKCFSGVIFQVSFSCAYRQYKTAQYEKERHTAFAAEVERRNIVPTEM